MTGALALAGITAGLDTVCAAENVYRLTIPATSAFDALDRLAEQTGYSLFYPADELTSVRSNSLDGSYSLPEALHVLLKGTRLNAVVTEKRVIVVSITPGSQQNSSKGESQMKTAVKKSSIFAGIATFLAAMITAPHAAGQDQAQGNAANRSEAAIEEIIVTAQKREQNLIDVPISITAISGRKLEEAGINNIQNLSFAVPSMSAHEISPGRQLITVRGVGGTRGNASLTGVYLDEMPLSGLQDGLLANFSNLGTVDLERVEVLKGPQGTLFGEGSVGGTVRFITKDPDLTSVGGNLSASVLSNADSDGVSGEIRGVLNVPVVKDKFGLRVAVTYDNTAGWIDRVATPNGPVIAEDFNDSELVNVRVKGLWTPTDKLMVTGMVVVNQSDGGGTNIVNTDDRDDSHFIIEFDPTAPTGFTDDYELYNLTATYDFGFAELLSSTSYADMNSVADLMQRKPLIPAPDPGFQELLIRKLPRDVSTFSQELRLSSKSAGPLTWTAGAFYKDDELARQAAFDFVRFGQVLLLGSGADAKDTFTSESWAVFGDISYALTSRLEVGGGVRYFEDDRETFNALAADVSATLLSGSFDATTYRGYLSFAVTDDIKAYGSVSKGFRSGGFNGRAVVDRGGPATFGPEDVISYELGAKMALADGRINVQVALFYSEYTDMQVNSIFTASDGTPIGATGNTGEAEITGFEGELSWAVTDRLTLGISGDVIDTEITKTDPRVQPAQFFVGDPVDQVPDYSIAASVDYGVHWLPSVPGYVRLQYNQQGKTTNVLRSLGALEPVTHTPVLNFLNASIGATLMGWDFELFGRNLLDESGALRSGGGIDPQARPRTIGLKVARSF